MNLAIHAGFAHAPCDQLSVLRPKINDQYSLRVRIGHERWQHIFRIKRQL
jgi:hypothetical protein